jgi:heme exporter protein A
MLEVRQLSCRRGEAQLFSGLSFRVEAGSALLVRGANGSGKTSLLRILSGLSTPHGGEVLWQGVPVRSRAAALRSQVLYLGHSAPLKDDLSVAENLDYALRLDGLPVSREQQLDVLTAVGLFTRRHLYAKQLSQGQRRRLGIARMMLQRRTLWLMDEPSTALDAQGIDLVRETLRRHLAQGGVAVVTTHQALDLDAPTQEITLQ